MGEGGGEEQSKQKNPKKANMHYLGQMTLIIDPEGAVKLMDYRLSVSGV